jgi:CBS domain containing-hemolysin-like protein
MIENFYPFMVAAEPINKDIGVPLYISIPIIVVLLVLSAFFSMSDMAFSSVNVLRLKKAADEGNKNAKIAHKLATKYSDTISTILFCNNITNIGISSLMVMVTDKIPVNDVWEQVISIVISVFLLLLVGEIIPKQIAKIYNYKLSLGFAKLLNGFRIVCFPFTFVFTKFATLLSKIFVRKKKVESEEEVDKDEELQEMVDKIEEEGIIDEKKADLVRSAIEFNNTEAYEIMTPRVDLKMFNIEDDVEELINDKEFFIYSRIPVYEEDKDNVIGILPMKLLQRRILAEQEINIRELLYKPLFVPRSMNICDILELFKEQKYHVAIVLDEYGGVEGLITIEDIIEELVGPIFDETDIVEKEFSTTKEGFIVDGSMNIDDFFNLVDIEPDFDDPSYNTVSGWVIDNLQRFGKTGDKFSFENLDVEVMVAEEFTVEKIKVKVNEDDED